MNFARAFSCTIFAGLTMFCSLAVFASPTNNYGPALDAGVIAFNNEGGEIALRGIDDPANPYAGQYGERDYWVLAHVDQTLDPAEIQRYSPNMRYRQGKEPDRSGKPEGWTTLRSMVDENGYLVPDGLMPDNWPSRPAPGKVKDGLDRFSRKPTKKYPTLYYINAAGVLAPERLEDFRNAAFRKKASDYPLIPAWLGEQPPLRTMFIPGGEIVVFGALGGDTEEYPPAYPPNRDSVGRWYHLDREGKLLNQTNLVRSRSNLWYSFFFKDFEEVYLGWRDKSNYSGGKPGVILFGHTEDLGQFSHLLPDPPVPTLLAAYTYDGQPLDPEDEMPQYGKHEFYGLYGYQIRQAYLGQVEQGLVDPVATVSPWVGKPGGAIVFDPSQVGTGKYASSRNGRSETLVEIRPLDDPDSPYTEMYGSWDHFIFENEGQSNPGNKDRYTAVYNEQREKVIALVEAGKDVPKELIQPQGYPVDPDDPWKHYSVYVDNDGYMIPMLHHLQNEQRIPLRVRTPDAVPLEQPFMFYAGGVMPQEILDAYDQAKFDARMEMVPAVPEWLSASPVHSAMPCPGGEWVTYGELGSWAEFVDAPRKDQRKQYNRLRLHRYSVDGELLEVGARFEQFWQRFYSPAVATLIDEVNNSMGALGAMPQNSFIQVFESDPGCESGG